MSGQRTRGSGVVAVGLAAAIVATAALVAACSPQSTADDGWQPPVPGPSIEAPDGVEEVCRVTDPRLTEISGLAASTQHPGILWTHNDSGDRAQIFALDSQTCAVVATLRINGVNARDTEAIAVGRDAKDRPVIWLGDIGDNAATWSSVRLYRLPEPSELSDQVVSPQATITVKYSDEPYNAEALLLQPQPAGRMWIVTRRQAMKGAYYELPAAIWGSSRTVTVTAAGSVPALTTDATYAPSGRVFAIRTYFGATQFDGTPPGEDGTPIDVGFLGQSEALTYSYDSRMLYTISEGENPPLLKVPLP